VTCLSLDKITPLLKAVFGFTYRQRARIPGNRRFNDRSASATHSSAAGNWLWSKWDSPQGNPPSDRVQSCFQPRDRLFSLTRWSWKKELRAVWAAGIWPRQRVWEIGSKSFPFYAVVNVKRKPSRIRYPNSAELGTPAGSGEIWCLCSAPLTLVWFGSVPSPMQSCSVTLWNVSPVYPMGSKHQLTNKIFKTHNQDTYKSAIRSLAKAVSVEILSWFFFLSFRFFSLSLR